MVVAEVSDEEFASFEMREPHLLNVFISTRGSFVHAKRACARFIVEALEAFGKQRTNRKGLKFSFEIGTNFYCLYGDAVHTHTREKRTEGEGRACEVTVNRGAKCGHSRSGPHLTAARPADSGHRKWTFEAVARFTATSPAGGREKENAEGTPRGAPSKTVNATSNAQTLRRLSEGVSRGGGLG